MTHRNAPRIDEDGAKVPTHRPRPSKAVYGALDTPARVLAAVPHPPEGRRENTEARLTGLCELADPSRDPADVIPDFVLNVDFGDVLGQFPELDIGDPAAVFEGWDPLAGFDFDMAEVVGDLFELLPPEVLERVNAAVDELLQGLD